MFAKAWFIDVSPHPNLLFKSPPKQKTTVHFLIDSSPNDRLELYWEWWLQVTSHLFAGNEMEMRKTNQTSVMLAKAADVKSSDQKLDCGVTRGQDSSVLLLTKVY